MTCRTATRELSAPAGRLTPAELRGHLAACPRCAAKADGLAKLDRIWAETRPDEPAAAWDALWAGVAAAADSPALQIAPATASAPRRGLRSAGWAAIGLAQAAAVVLAVVLSNPDRTADHSREVADAGPVAPVEAVPVEFGQGETPVFRFSDKGAVVFEMREPPEFEGDMLNLFESMDN